MANEMREFEELRRVARRETESHTLLDEIRWPNNSKIAVNFTVDFDAMLLRRLLNEPPMQLAKGEFGGRVGIWRLIELFDSSDIKFTVFTPGRICELYPAAVKAAASGGHEIADHMWEHRVPAEPEIERAHLVNTMAAIERLTGRKPVGTRSTHTAELLEELGFIYRSNHHDDDRPFLVENKVGRLLNLPFHYSIDDAMFFNFGWYDSENAAQRITDPDRILELWWNSFVQQYEAGGYLNICLHPFVSGRSLRITMLDSLISRMKTRPGVWFATCEQVARHFIEAIGSAKS